jgi:hypothetical protein
MKTPPVISEEIRELQSTLESLLSEEDIMWDEVNTVKRDLDSLKQTSRAS